MRLLTAGATAVLGLLASNPAAAATYYLQAERAEVVRGVSEKSNAGYTGSGYVNYADETGSYIEWVIQSDADISGVLLRIRYANGAASGRPMRILVNGTQVGSTVSFSPTGGWTSWWSKQLGTVALRKGANTVRAEATSSAGGPNVDRLAVDSSKSVSLVDWGRAVVDSALQRFPDPAQLGTGSYGRNWRYPQGVFLLGTYRTAKRVPAKASYITYIRGWVDARTDATGLITQTTDPNPPLPAYLDTVMPGRVALVLQQEFGSSDSRYGLIADRLWNALGVHKRLPSPNFLFSHTNGKAGEVLLDGTYMALPFMASYGTSRGATLVGYPDLAGDALGQLARYPVLLQDKSGTQAKPAGGTLLLYQAYDNLGKASWLVPGYKHSGVFWLRGLGWYAMALVDVLETVGGTPAQRAPAIAALADLAAGLESAFDAPSGRWFNVIRLDASSTGATIPGNYPETSGSAMMVYALSKAIANGWLPATYGPLVSKAYKGVLSQLGVKSETIGGVAHQLVTLRGIAPGQLPKATAAEYLATLPIADDFHGLGAFMLMYEQVKAAPQTITP